MVKTSLGSRGITLTEVLIVTAILSLIGLVAPKLMQQSNEFFLMNRGRLEVQQEARMIVSDVSRNLRQAISTTIVISQLGGQAPYSSITFNKRVKDFTQANTTGDAIRYFVRDCADGTGRREFVCSINGRERVLSKNVRFAAFGFPRIDDRRVISFSLSLEKPLAGGKSKALHVTSEKIGVMNL